MQINGPNNPKRSALFSCKLRRHGDKTTCFFPTVKGIQLKRRDFHRLSLGMGLSPVLAGSAFAQMSTEEVDTPSSPQKPQRTIVANSPRTYNQSASQVCSRPQALQYLLDLELSMGSEP